MNTRQVDATERSSGQQRQKKNKKFADAIEMAWNLFH